MRLWTTKIANVDLEKLVNKFNSIILSLLLALPLFAQVDSTVIANSDSLAVTLNDSTAEQAPLPVIEYTLQPKTYEIADIIVTGADSYEDFVLIGFSGLAVGDKIEVPGAQITKSLKRFWKQGLFSDIKFKANKIEGDKIWLEIALTQRPRVSSIVYNGLRKTEQEEIEVKVGIKQGGQMTHDLADRAKKIITKHLEEKGFYHTKVVVNQYDDPDKPGYVKVAINVYKNEKTRVGQIFVSGNQALTATQINRAMKKTNDNHIINLFRPKKFVATEFENDKKLIIEKYNEIGYRDAIILSDSIVQSPIDSTRVDVYLTIDEGSKYVIGDITWVGNTVYPYEYLDAILGNRFDDTLLQNFNIAAQAYAQLLQVENRIADHLSLAVEGDVATAVNMKELCAEALKILLGDKHILLVATLAQCIYCGMLNNEYSAARLIVDESFLGLFLAQCVK